MSTPPNPSPSDDPASGSGGAWLRRLAWSVVGMGTTVLVAVGLGLGILQFEGPATATVRVLADRFNPLPGTTISVGEVSGTWVGSLQLVDVALARTDSTGARLEMARVDTVQAQYNLTALLQNRLHLSRTRVAGPSITLRQAADSTWDWARILPESEYDTTASTFAVQIDRAALARGAVTAHFHTGPRPDSVARVRDLRLQVRNVATGPAFTAQIDTLGLRARVPRDSADLTLASRAALSADRFRLDTLRLDSPRSRVRGEGSVRLPQSSADSLSDVDLRLSAQPFALRDLIPFAPGLVVDPAETITADLHVTGSERQLRADLDAAFSRGGTVTAQAAATPTVSPDTTALAGAAPSANALVYQLDARVRTLTTSLLGPSDPAVNRINADARFRLQGPALNTLNGPARIQLRNTRLAGLRTDSTRLDATFRQGSAALTLTGGINDAGLRVTGNARLLDAVPTFNLTGRLRNVNVNAFAPEAGVESDLGGTLRVAGRVDGEAGLNLGVDLDLGPSRINGQPLTGGTAAVRITPDTLHFDAGLDVPEGSLRTAGHAALDGSEAFTLTEGRLQNLPLAALAGDSTASSITGRLQADGRGLDPATMDLRAELTLQNTSYAHVQVERFSGETTLRSGRLNATLDARVNGSDWNARLRGRPVDRVPTLQVTDGRFRTLDLYALAGDTTGTSRLQGAFSAQLRGFDPQTLTASAGVRLDSSQVNRQSLPSGRLDLSLSSGRLTLATDLVTDDGGVQLRAAARPFEDVIPYSVTDGRLTSLRVGALLGINGLSTDLSGTFAAEGRGTDPATLALTAELAMDTSRVNRAALPRGSLQVAVENGRAEAEAEVEVESGALRLNATVDSLAAVPVYAIAASAQDLDVGRLARADTTLRAVVERAEWTMDGRGADPATARATTSLQTGRVHVGAFQIDAVRLNGRLADGLLTVDTLDVQSNAVIARGSGPVVVAADSGRTDFDLSVDFADAGPLKQLLGAQRFSLSEGTAGLSVYGEGRVLRFDGEVSLRSLIYDDVRLARAQMPFNGRVTPEGGLEAAEARGEVTALAYGATASLEDARFTARYDSAGVNLDAYLAIDQSHTVDLRADAALGDTTSVTLERLRLNLQDNEWSLLQPSTITVGEAIRVQSLLLYSGNQQIAADGVINVNGPQNFGLTVEGFEVGSVSSLVDLRGLGGRLGGEVSLTGPAEAPTLTGQLRLDVESEDREVGTLDLSVDYDSLTLRTDATLTHVDGGDLTLAGTLPMDLRLAGTAPVDVGSRPLDLTARSDTFSLGWVGPFLDPATVRNVDGEMNARIDIEGTLDRPELSGRARLTRGTAELPELGVDYYGGEATVVLRGDSARIESAVLRSGNGRLRASGAVTFTELTLGAFDLALDARNFEAIDTRAYRKAVIDGGLTLRGTTRSPVLQGDLRIQSADIFFTEATEASAGDVATVALSNQDQLVLEERFNITPSGADTTTFDAYEALTMNLTVTIQRDTWLRSQGTPELNIPFTGDLELSKVPNADQQVFGTIEVVRNRGSIRQFGREFEITQGTLTFNGDPTMPYLNITAAYQPRVRETGETSVRITLTLEGQPDDLATSLSSNPQMDTRNIFSYLATGRPSGEASSGADGSLVTDVPLGIATGFVENLAANQLGLDVVRLQVRPGDLSYLTVGRYFTPRFFVAIEQPVSNIQRLENSNAQVPDLTLEYSLTNSLLLRALTRRQALQLNVLWEKAY